MAQLVSVAGSKLYIGRRVAFNPDADIADYTGASWTEIKGLTTLGALSNQQNWITQDFIDSNFTAQIKGTVSGGTMENVFAYLHDDPGQTLLRQAIEECSDYEFKLEMGSGCIPTSTATITIGTPGVVTVAEGHGFEIDAPVVFATSGALPTGLTVGTTYYVLSGGFTPTSFSVAATPGGTAIDTSVSQSGTHTVTGQPVGATALFRGQPGEGSMNGGEANTPQLQSYPIAVNSRIRRI